MISRLGIPIALVALILIAIPFGASSAQEAANSQSGPAEISSSSPDAQNPLLVTVNGEEIRRNKVIDRMGILSMRGAPPDVTEVLGQMVAETLFIQAASQVGQIASASEVESVHASLLQRAGGAENLERQLTTMGTSVDAFMKEQKRQITIGKVLDWKTSGKISVEDASIEKTYADNPDLFERIQCRHILIRTNPEGETTAAREKIDALAARLRSGEEFGVVAQAESEDPGSAAKGGDLGEFGHGQMVPAFDQAAFALEAGQISEVVQTQFGFHLVKMESRRTVPLNEVQGELRKALEAQERERIIDEWLAELEGKATITFPASPESLSRPSGENP